jgi:hypothetical protein
MLSNSTTEGHTGCKGNIIVVDDVHRQTRGLVRVKFDPSAYEIPGCFSWDRTGGNEAVVSAVRVKWKEMLGNGIYGSMFCAAGGSGTVDRMRKLDNGSYWPLSQVYNDVSQIL